jgi:hypothetical protein
MRFVTSNIQGYGHAHHNLLVNGAYENGVRWRGTAQTPAEIGLS